MGWKRKKLDGMGDEDLCDVHLVGIDGEEVPCCKTFLATTSPVFKSMFFRGFREQKTDRCSLNFHSLVISVIVKYCYCGEVDMDLIFRTSKSVEEEVTLLVELREAGNYFEIEDLSAAAEAKIGNLVFHRNIDKKKYQYAAACVTELIKRQEDKGPLWLTLFRFAALNPMECFIPRDPENKNRTCHTHPRVLARVLLRRNNEYVTVRCIQEWFLLESKSAGNGYSDEEKRDLKEIAKKVDLKKLSVAELSSIEPCPLFSTERIRQALVHHLRSREVIPVNIWTEPRLFISGADKKTINGTYLQTPYDVNVFYKNVKIGDHPCFSLVHRKHEESKWFVSITENGEINVNTEGDVEEECIFLDIYESACQSLPTDDPELPPFSGWKCVVGAGPGPFVACTYH